jgi:hypothetical protein
MLVSPLFIQFQHVDSFVLKLAEEEKDRIKRQKLMNLQLGKDEWERVTRFLNLLAVCHSGLD